MAVTLESPRFRNDFSTYGFQITDNTDYMTIYEFEKQNFAAVHLWAVDNIPLAFKIAFAYLVVIFVVRKWMENREPFELRKPLFVWNLFLAGLSVIMFVRILPELLYVNKKYGFYSSYCLKDHFNSATFFWGMVYTASKILEFVDTIFIVLRKQKLTFLHVFHHTSVFIACVYGLLQFDPAARWFCLMNSMVHSVMYTYFALKAAQVKLPRKLAMAVTSVQLIQFATAIVINLLVAYAKVMGTQPTCQRPDDVSLLYGALAIIYFILFGNFFVESYLKRKPEKAKIQ